MERFNETQTWIFDLDNTLYPAECDLFIQVVDKMNQFIIERFGMSEEEASALRRQYYLDHGTTLAGLMKVNNIEPEYFLEFVHDIDLDVIDPAPDLAAKIEALPGRRFIFTNGSRLHAERVAGKVGVLHLFEEIYDITAAGYVPKPHREAYDLFLTSHGVTPDKAAMFEDMPHNLETAHDLGMATVLVTSPYVDHPAKRAIAGWQEPPDHIHHMTDNLTAFLDDVGDAIADSTAPAAD